MNIEMLRSFFLGCTVINYGLLLVWALLYMGAHDGFFRWWLKWVPVSAEQFDMLNVGGISLYKIGVLLFNLVPCVVLYTIK